MTDIKEQIVASVREIDELNRAIADYWSLIQICLAEKRVDDGKRSH